MIKFYGYSCKNQKFKAYRSFLLFFASYVISTIGILASLHGKFSSTLYPGVCTYFRDFLDMSVQIFVQIISCLLLHPLAAAVLEQSYH